MAQAPTRRTSVTTTFPATVIGNQGSGDGMTLDLDKSFQIAGTHFES